MPYSGSVDKLGKHACTCVGYEDHVCAHVRWYLKSMKTHVLDLKRMLIWVNQSRANQSNNYITLSIRVSSPHFLEQYDPFIAITMVMRRMTMIMMMAMTEKIAYTICWPSSKVFVQERCHPVQTKMHLAPSCSFDGGDNDLPQ